MNKSRLVDESREKPEDGVRKLQRLRNAVSRARTSLTAADASPASVRARLADLADEMKLWDTCMEEVRVELAALIAERDSWRIAHDKLRERMDYHSIEPRTDPDQQPQSGRMPTPRAQQVSGESQDFSAIDRELERLNASMLRAFSSE